jgi:hypothetical protein
MANDTCPHCGAERRYMERYDCGTWLAGVVGNNEVRAGICWDRQLATVTAERDELRRRIDEAPVWFAVISSRHDSPAWVVPNEKTATGIDNFTPGACGVVRVRLIRDDQPEETVT